MERYNNQTLKRIQKDGADDREDVIWRKSFDKRINNHNIKTRSKIAIETIEDIEQTINCYLYLIFNI